MIPKIIHYCWFGFKGKNKVIENCIRSWKRYLPDWEIIEWNETNTNLDISFIQKFYQLKKWAFVTDYVRLEKLFEFGGVYLDTDMLLVKSLDFLTNLHSFWGSEDKHYISCGIIGAEKENQFIKQCLDFYKTNDFTDGINLEKITMPIIITNIFKSRYNIDREFDKIVDIDDIVIYPQEYFYPLPVTMKRDFNNLEKYLTPSSVTVHLWMASWVELSEFELISKREYLSGMKKMLKNLFANQKLTLIYIKQIFQAFISSVN